MNAKQLRGLNICRFGWYNFASRSVRREDGYLLPYGHVVCSFGPSARIELCAAHLTLNVGCIRSSRAETRLDLQGDARLVVRGNFAFYYDCDVMIQPGGTLELHGGYANAGSQIRCAQSIIIGKNATIARNVLIMDSDFHAIEYEDGTPHALSEPVVIGDNVWIGNRAIVVKGVTIGNNSVIGTGSIVTHDIPENTLAAGVPARPIKTIKGWHH